MIIRLAASKKRLLRRLTAVLIFALLAAALCACAAGRRQKGPLPVQVLIIPKFEVDQMTGDFPGEAQYYYETYLAGGDVYEIGSGEDAVKLYYKDGAALFVTGQGKISAALSTAAVLSDDRFDFSGAYILSTGCAGSAAGYGIMGDVYVISATVDYDLGHHADPREMTVETDTTWFRVDEYDEISAVRLDPALVARVYDLVKDVQPKTTAQTEAYLKRAFPGEAWADRAPAVLRGTAVTGDNFWKGFYGHSNALLITETYNCPDPFAVTEMEEVAIARTVKRFGLLDRLIVIRCSVNMDLFPPDTTPESLWGDAYDDLAGEESEESADIFATAMENNFAVGRIIIDAILSGELQQ